MAKILCVETSTNVCSVALSMNGKCTDIIETSNTQSHSSQLSIQVQNLCINNNLKLSEIDAIALSKGPGSYTGLRIGASLVKGLLYVLQKPFIAIDTLKTLCAASLHSVNDNAMLCPMLDARRMEVYNAFYNTNLETIKDVEATVINENSFIDLLNENEVYFFGNGAKKCKPFITHNNAKFIDGIECSAEWMCRIAEDDFSNTKFENIAYFEPSYLKEFQATQSKKIL